MCFLLSSLTQEQAQITAHCNHWSLVCSVSKIERNKWRWKKIIIWICEIDVNEMNLILTFAFPFLGIYFELSAQIWINARLRACARDHLISRVAHSVDCAQLNIHRDEKNVWRLRHLNVCARKMGQLFSHLFVGTLCSLVYELDLFMNFSTMTFRLYELAEKTVIFRRRDVLTFLHSSMRYI